MTAWRKLGRDSEHRQALLRNLVTSLVRHEAIETTWHKAKEAQRVAEKLITLAKRNTETSRRIAQGLLYTPHELLPKLFGEIRERYANRHGGYTRVLHTESQMHGHPVKTAILELVDGPKDMRFAMTAAAVARDRRLGRQHTDITKINIAKVIQFRADGEERLEAMVQKLMGGDYITKLAAPDVPLGPSGIAGIRGGKRARAKSPRTPEKEEKLARGKQERRERRQAEREGPQWEEQFDEWEEELEEGDQRGEEEGGEERLPRRGGDGAESRHGKEKHQTRGKRNGGSGAQAARRDPYETLAREKMRAEEKEHFKRWAEEEQGAPKKEKGWLGKAFDLTLQPVSRSQGGRRWGLPKSDREP